MKKSELREMIRECLREELKTNKLNESTSVDEIEDDLYFRGMRREFGEYEDTVAYEMADRAEMIFGLDYDTAYELAWKVVSRMKDRGYSFIEGEEL